MHRRSDWRITAVDVEAKIVFLVDLNLGRMSVTNDAENVVMTVHRDYPDYRIVYRDSQGDWDELVHQFGVFQTFQAYLGAIPSGAKV